MVLLVSPNVHTFAGMIKNGPTKSFLLQNYTHMNKFLELRITIERIKGVKENINTEYSQENNNLQNGKTHDN